MSRIDVALYSDEASAERYEEKAFIKTNTDYVKIGPESVMNGDINRYKVLFLPGAFPLRHHGKGGFFAFLGFLRRISSEYRYRFLDYIEKGGCLIAICAAAGIMGRSIKFPYIHTSLGIRPMGFFNYDAVYSSKMGVIDIMPLRYDDSRLDQIVKKTLGKYGYKNKIPVLTFRGPLYTYNRSPDKNEILVAKYTTPHPKIDGKGAISVKFMGKGCVIACAVHPEMNSWDLFKSMIEFGQEVCKR